MYQALEPTPRLLVLASVLLTAGACSDDEGPRTTDDAADTILGDVTAGGADDAAADGVTVSADTTVLGDSSDDTSSTVGDAGGASDAAPTSAPTLGDVVGCGKKGAAGGVNAGDGLFRYDIDLAAYPDALCNDGTGAVMYVRRADTPAAADRWLIRLQGGGGCRSGQGCAQRWCSADTNFGMDKMTTSLAPARGISAPGVHARRADNPFSGWNHVFVYYCSSDNWSGQAGAVETVAESPDVGEARFTIHFNGAHIVDAVLGSLRRLDGAAVSYSDTGDTAMELPDLDDAATVVLAGASAGGGGVVRNLDHLADTLPGAQVYGLIDSTWGPRVSALGFENTVWCQDSGLCDYESFQKTSGVVSLWQSRVDASCLTWHEANAPGSSWRCQDNGEVLPNHLTTPFFVRMGLTDSLISGNMIEAGYTGPDGAPLDQATFAALVAQQLRDLADIKENAHEADAITLAPGWFGPGCGKHETLGNNAAVYDTTIASDGQEFTMFDVIQQWRSGNGAPGLVATELGAGCP